MTVRRLSTVWILLMVLLALTFGVARVDLGPFNLPLALVVATVKAILVLAVFMELKESTSLVRLFAGLGFFWLAILLTLGLGDFLGRRTTTAQLRGMNFALSTFMEGAHADSSTDTEQRAPRSARPR